MKNSDSNLSVLNNVDDDIRAVVDRSVTTLTKMFHGRGCSIYLMGSLSRGGFSSHVSDIDIGLIIESPLHADDSIFIEQCLLELQAKFSVLPNPISIFWGSPEAINNQTGGRFPSFDRLDLIEHATLIHGKEVREQLVKPDLKELEIDSAKFAIKKFHNPHRLNELFHPESLAAENLIYLTKTVLFPVRFIYFSKTGNISGNAESVNYYLSHFNGSDSLLVEEAYHWRMGENTTETSRMQNVLSNGLAPLFLNFLDIYIARMELYRELSIKARLLEWKETITERM